MMANNWKRLNIWLALGNRFDYREFEEACGAAGVQALPALEFAQKAGMITCGMIHYPESPVAEAYLKFIAENQIAFPPTSSFQMVAQPDSGTPPMNGAKPCCGGGKVV